MNLIRSEVQFGWRAIIAVALTCMIWGGVVDVRADTQTVLSAPTAVTAPNITASVPFFYYQDLAKAKKWYGEKLGLELVTEHDWVAIYEIRDGAHVGLVNASGGTLRPTDNKGVLLSIETDDLEEWWKRLSVVDGINIKQGIKTGADGMIEEFRLQDPGGYIIEFFRWKPEFDPRRSKEQ